MVPIFRIDGTVFQVSGKRKEVDDTGTVMCYSQIISADGWSCGLWEKYWILTDLPFTLIEPGKTGWGPSSVFSWCEYNIGPQMDFPVYVNTTLTCQTFRYFPCSFTSSNQHF